MAYQIRLPECIKHPGFLEYYCTHCAAEQNQSRSREQQIRNEYIAAQLGAQAGGLAVQNARHQLVLSDALSAGEAQQIKAADFFKTRSTVKQSKPKISDDLPIADLVETPKEESVLKPTASFDDIKTGFEDWVK